MSSFFFYDLETSGVSPRRDRIMQFAGQRTDMELKPIGEPYNILIKMTDDVVPQPDAILVTGITPQQTIAEGISESEFAKLFYKEIATPDTIFVGFNNIRFDDEFMRFLFWRNFYDPYEWQWKLDRGRWDLLDVTRMMRALRPDGIKWPFAPDGKPTNRLEYLAAVNKLDQTNAHDALSDVKATIALARLVMKKQPKLFRYLLGLRNKTTTEAFVKSHDTFVYSSGKYDGEFEKTTVVKNLGPHPDKNGALVYDLRWDPDDYLSLSASQLAELWRYDPDKKRVLLPVKSLQFNRCPAIAPLSVVDEHAWKRLGLSKEKIKAHEQKIAAHPEFIDKLSEAIEIINDDRVRAQAELIADEKNADERLYDGFVPDADRQMFTALHASEPDGLSEFKDKFEDKRLKLLLPLYKARNFPESLTREERLQWERIRRSLLTSGGESSRLTACSRRLEVLEQNGKLGDKDRFLLQDIKLWLKIIEP